MHGFNAPTTPGGRNMFGIYRVMVERQTASTASGSPP
jgi:hypothetical protein